MTRFNPKFKMTFLLLLRSILHFGQRQNFAMSLSLPTKIPSRHPNAMYHLKAGNYFNSRPNISTLNLCQYVFPSTIHSSSIRLYMSSSTSSSSKVQSSSESQSDSNLTEEEIKLQRAKVKEERKAKKQKARDKRREFIGMAKARP